MLIAALSMHQKMSEVWLKNFEGLPQQLVTKAQSLQVEDGYKDFVFNGKTVKLHHKQCIPVDVNATKHTILFLHGASFSSQTWNDLGTLQFGAAVNCRCIAIDLPGYGKSPPACVEKDNGSFLQRVAEEFSTNKLVLVSASMSGRFALPFVFKSHVCGVKGFIPIAPVGTSEFSSDDYTNCQVRTLILYGERDVHAPVDTLRQMPNSTVAMFSNAGHACYMDNPSEWHRQLYSFLSSLPDD